MARATTITQIPLDNVATHLGIDPWHFNGVYTDARPFVPNCPDDWYQYAWQASGKLSREDLAYALRQAEDNVARWLNWTPLPRWFTDEVDIPAYYKTEMYTLTNAQGYPKSVFSNYKHVLEIGARANTLIDTPATVFSDPDGDGVDELVTITVATTVTEEQELHVYYPSKDGRDEWEIRPLTSISISGGVATITFPKYLIVLEDLMEEPSDPDDPHIGVDGSVNANFLASVDVYRVYTDTSQQVTFHYEELDCSTTPCAPLTETGCGRLRNNRLGIIAVERADWDATTEAYINKSFTSVPKKAIINYRAGNIDQRMKFPYIQMDTGLERMISYYALSLLNIELCGCDNTRNIWQKMTRDMSVSTGDMRIIVPWGDLSNPLGTAFSAINLWKQIKELKVVRTPMGGLL